MKDINLFRSTDSIFLKKIKSKSETPKDDDCDGYLIESTEKEARRIIESLKGTKKKMALVGESDAFNRRAIETLKINYLVLPGHGNGKDTLKQRDSGLNHVVAKEAAKKNISIIINMAELRSLKGKEKSLALEKIIQNIKICRKANCKINIASLGTNNKELIDEKGRRSFGTSLGMSSTESSKSTEF